MGRLRNILNKIPDRYRLAVGWFLVILGALLGLVPILQGWVFGIPGLIILAERYDWARRMLDWAKKKVAPKNPSAPTPE